MKNNKSFIIALIVILLGIYWVFMGYIEYKADMGVFGNLGDFGKELYKDNFFEKVGIRLLLVVSVLLAVIIINIVKLYNKMVSYKESFEKALSSVDVYLKQRFDLIPNLVETVKAYSNYEKETLESIIKLRTKFDVNDKNIIDKSNLDNEYSNFIARVEAYPELKANENFLDLQKQLAKMENQIQAARRAYNMQVTEYNILIKKFPNSIVASIFGFKEQKLFEAKAEEKEVVKV